MPATRLTTKRVEKPWGRHDLWPGFADVAEGGEPVGEIWFEAAGDPELLVKYLFTSDKLSIQVHPDDAFAQARGYRARQGRGVGDPRGRAACDDRASARSRR